MRFDPSKPAAQLTRDLLDLVIQSSGLELSFTVSGDLETGKLPAGAITQSGPASGQLVVEFSGPDTPVLTARNGELLNALEHIAAKVLRLEPEEHDLICFDADSFKSNRDRELRQSAARAIEVVRGSGFPYSFPPMTSRERRLLHLVLSESGLPTASSGENPRRFVVLYPDKPAAEELTYATSAAAPARTDAVRNSFRRR